MSFEIPQVFVSSTSEFQAQRQEVAEALRRLEPPFEPFVYEEEPARGESPRQHCAAQLDRSEVVVLILGSSYGSSFPGESKSIVEWEYEYARRRQTELQAYVKESEAEPVDPRQSAFIGRVRDFTTGTWVKSFREGRELVAMVRQGVEGWRNRCWLLLKREQSGRVRWASKLLLSLGGAIAVGTLAAVGIGVWLGSPTSSLLVLAGTGFGMLIVLLLLIKFPPI